jgi:hypothetical protein
MSESIDQQIYNAALSKGFTPTSAKFLVAQARHETGNYTSNVFKLNNNLFGMKFANQPLATKGSPAPSSEVGVYAKYNSPADSIKDQVDRYFVKTMGGVTFEELKASQTPLEYATNLKKRGYFTDTIQNYVSGIERALLRIQVMDIVKKNYGKIILGLTLIGYSIYLYKKKA